MKTSWKLTFSLWLTLITTLAPVDSGKAGGVAESNFQTPLAAPANMPGYAAALPDGNTCTFLSENFDGVTAPALPAGWLATNAQGAAPLWVTSTTTPDTFPNDAFIDDPAAVSDKRLDTPNIAISSAAAQVSFRNFYTLENTFDGGVLEVSSPNINGGAFTDITDSAVGGSFVTGGYNATISSSFGSPIGGRMAWSGNTGTYINTVANLGQNVNGQTIKLRFRMASDNSAAAAGWRIDTIKVSAPGACPIPTPTPRPTATATASPCGTVLSQNFDGVTAPVLPTGWVATNAQGTAPFWVTSNISAHTAPNDAFVDDPATISDKRLDTPSVAISSGTARVTFQNNFNLESTFDGGVLEVSIGGGAFTDIITAGGSFVTGGYNATISTAFQSPIEGRPAWTGNSAGYITTIANLGPNVAGQTIILRFRMASDNSTAATGWRIDTVTITDACPRPSATPTATSTPAGPPVITSPLNASCVTGQSFSYQFEAVNATTLGANNLPPGLSFNTSLAAIVGTPTSAGTFPVALRASNNAGTTLATLTITVQPVPTAGPIIASDTAATGRVGQPFSFRVYTTGGTSGARVSASNLPPGLSINAVPGVPGLISGTPTVAGSTAVTLTVTDGSFTASSILELTFTVDPTRPVIVSSNSASLTPGQFFSYEITADAPGPTTFSLIGTLPPGLGFDGIDTISGVYTGSLRPELAGGALLGSIQLFATNGQGTSTFQLLFRLTPSGVVNISTRLSVKTGESVLIGGFIITGNAPKVVIVRAIGPSLNPFLSGALQDPTLELHDSANNVVFNDNWKDTQEQFIRDTEIPPADDREAAIVIGLDPGSYTAIVAGKNGTTGIALVEVYDLGTASLNGSGNDRLANIATRGFVDTGNNVMIGGFQIRSQATRVVVRAIGPSLNPFLSGALQDPTLELKDSNGATLISNDDWQAGRPPAEIQEIQQLGLAPTDPRESALITTPALAPAGYTAIVSGKNNTIGVALVEVYALP